MKVFPAVRWYVDSLIPEGLTLLAGPSKIGKSFLAWNIATAVASGGVALQCLEIPEPRQVFYLALEDPEQQLQERLKMMCPDGVSPNLFYATNFGGMTMNVKGIEVLERYLDENETTEMIIIDTWKHVAPPPLQKGTAYDVDYSAILPIQRVAHQRNISIILVTHTRKAIDVENPFNQIQGSTGMQAGCDTMLMMARGESGVKLHVTGRRVLEEDYAISLKDGIWKLEGDIDSYSRSAAQEKILMSLGKNRDGMTLTDIAEAIDKSKTTVRQTLTRLAKEGVVTQPKKRGPWYLVEGDDISYIKF